MTNVTSLNGNHAGNGKRDNHAEHEVIEPLHKIIGEQVRRSRRSLGLSSTHLSATAKISVSYLSKIEHGHIVLSISTIRLLAAAQHKPIASLLVEAQDDL